MTRSSASRLVSTSPTGTGPRPHGLQRNPIPLARGRQDRNPLREPGAAPTEPAQPCRLSPIAIVLPGPDQTPLATASGGGSPAEARLERRCFHAFASGKVRVGGPALASASSSPLRWFRLGSVAEKSAAALAAVPTARYDLCGDDLLGAADRARLVLSGTGSARRGWRRRNRGCSALQAARRRPGRLSCLACNCSGSG
jgi:hypothetical protein